MRVTLKKSHFFSILLSLTGFFILNGQQVQLHGQVIDSISSPLPYTNLIATPLEGNLKISFAITDENGNYKLPLQVSTPYKIEVSHLGFSKITDTLQITQDTKKNYTLLESSELLDQVIVSQKMAVVAKEDTIVYRTNQFKTGEERKLREVLRKLPGIEVDKAGNVKVNGKKVTKLMVEGQTFFTGDSKLAVNNIPADVVDEIVVLDNYSEIAFLKGLTDSNQMALDIKLKEDKKEFIFGDLEMGSGIKKRFLLHPTLFYYGKKTAINVIGDINNIGKKSFTLNDYINFEGGYTALLDGSTSFANIYDSDFAKFLNQKKFLYQKNDFGAGSISQKLSPSLKLEAFTIINKGKTEHQINNTINYFTDNLIDENRKTITRNNLVFALSKIKLKYQPNTNTDLAYNASFKSSNGDAIQNINSFSLQNSRFTNTDQQLKNVSIHQDVVFNKKFSLTHTSTVAASYNYNKKENDYKRLFNQPIFNVLIPLEEEENDFYNLLNTSSVTKHEASINFKHYWILDNLNHIYPQFGITYRDDSFASMDGQLLEDGSINSFQDNDFNNDTNFKLNDAYIGLHYKVKKGNLIFKPGLVYHYYSWNVNQFSEEVNNNKKSVLLPEFNVKYKLTTSEKIEFDYRLKTGFSNVEYYANRLRLTNFNQLRRGNENLENELYHTARLNYRQFNLYKGVYINANLSYIHRKKSIRNTTQIEGVDQVNTSIYTSLPEQSYVVSSSFGKQLGDYKLTLLGNLSLNDYKRVINDKLIDYNSNDYGYTFKVKTNFKDLPNFEIGWNHQWSSLKSVNFKNNFTQIDPYLNLNWTFLNNFDLRVDYSYINYKNQNTNQINQFNTGNLSLNYNKDNSPWSFEIDASNVFDVRNINENLFNQFLVEDTKIFVQPRTILLKISYKF